VADMQQPFLVGEFECTLDAKNRIAVPARLRGFFDEGIYVTRGHERCLAGYAPVEFERFLEEQTQGVSTLKSKVRALERFTAASAVHQALDKQGRIVLPPRHLSYAAIGREATIIGVRDHIEIWDRAAWAAYLAHLEEEADATADELAAQ
jgi:MraZ protein